METKEFLLHDLELRIHQCWRRALSEPGNERVHQFVKSLKLLYDDLSMLPSDHKLFAQWQRQPWAPIALSDSNPPGDCSSFY